MVVISKAAAPTPTSGSCSDISGCGGLGCSRTLVRGGVIVLLLIVVCLGQESRAQSPDPSNVIRKISIPGLKRESESDLLASLREKIRFGDDFDEARVSEAAGQLWLTGKFSEVKEPRVFRRDDGVEIIFDVVERPTIVSVRFEGSSELSENHLKTSAPALRTRAGSLLNESHLLQDKQAIVQKYHDAGYIFAIVEHRTTELAKGVRVIFDINEGTRVRVREVRFINNRAFSAGDLISVMSTRKKGWFFGLITPGFYDYDTLQGDLVNIANFYHQHGYFDARVELDGISFDRSSRWLTVVIRIKEGEQYILRGYQFAGNAVFSDETLQNLTTAITGQPFDFETVQKDREEISNFYGDRAYIEADVKAEPIPLEKGNDVYVRFDVEENNEIYIEQIRVRGNIKTQDKVIRRELEFYPGERVDRSKVVESRSNLNRLQIFSNVNITYEKGERSAPGNRHVVVTVEEQSTGRLILGFGVTSGFGIIGNFSITKRNFDATDLPDSFYDIPDSFTGSGQTLNIVAQPGTRRSLYRFSLTEPYLFDTRNALTLSASVLTIIRDDYDEARASFAPRIAHAFDFDRDFVVSVGNRTEEVEITRIDNDAPADAFDVEGHTTVLAANTAARYDKVLYEYLEGPYDGTNSEVLYELAGGPLGGEVNFHKIETTNDFYYPLYTYQSGPDTLHHVISLTNRLGWIEPIEDDESVPIFERFFLGGPNTVRGFQFREMGPHDGRDPVGGTAMLYGNLEYGFPLFQKVLRGVLFTDYGNLATELNDVDFDETRLVLGGGLRVNFPFLGQPLPIGLYLGKAVKKESADRERLFLFTIGARF